MQMKALFAAVGLLFVPLGAFPAGETQNPLQLLRVRGILSQQSDLHWQIAADHRIQFNGKDIDVIKFAVDSFTEATWCQPNNGKKVEISGGIDSISGGIADMTPDIIDVGEQGPISPSGALRAGRSRLLLGQPDPTQHAPGQPLYRFAYYLVLIDPPDGCERCYVPLLILPETLDSAARQHKSVNTAWVTTYERDSIWHMNGTVLLTPNAIDLHSTILRFRGKHYRYELASDADVLRLLEHPMGTIPISRPFLGYSETTEANISDLVADFHTVFRVRERRRSVLSMSPGVKSSDHVARIPESTAATSELTVFDDGRIEYRSAPACVNGFEPDQMPKSHLTVESWSWRKTCPGGQRVETSSQSLLNQQEFAHLKELLNREEVKRIVNCFCNAAGTFDDYDIEIPRPDSNQAIPVVNFMPQHFELLEHPALTYLICEAKTIAGNASHEEIPGWCHDLPPLK
jgi:hypothetical protein